MKRLKWNEITIGHNFYLKAEGCEYFIHLWQTNRGTRAQVLTSDFFPASSETTITIAKRKAKELQNMLDRIAVLKEKIKELE